MKQLLSLFLFLLPCLAWAQYPSNGNQKITLGEQTTADGLIYRGVIGDTALITPLSDTSAYIILDTVNHRFYNYNRATNVWSVAGGVTTFSAGTTGLTPSTATSGAVTLGGTLAVANGGTGASTFTAGSVVFAGASGTYTQDNAGLFYNNTNDRLAIGTTNTDIIGYGTKAILSIHGVGEDAGAIFIGKDGVSATTVGNLGDINFYSKNATSSVVSRMIFRSSLDNSTQSNKFEIWTQNGNDLLKKLTIYKDGNLELFSLAGSGSRAVNADVNGVLSAASSILIKENVENINYGLLDVLKLKPVIFNYIDKNKWGEGKDLGFVAEDVMNVIPEATGVMNNSDIYFDLQKLIPVLTKAIQEQQALIKALEQRLLILENK
jgi:hypothetical protein